ncbi:MAG: adenine deaminase [Candidatus Rokubacteria bacterium]|nr:adenine deaminase [Candidatus Rokubacteria bacterium]
MSDRARLMRVALGEAPADLLVTGATVVNVYTGELIRWDVAVAGERVAATGPDLGGLAGPATARLDAAGHVLVPGFIDGHTHLDTLVSLPELLREAIPRGLTALVTEMGQLTSALGSAGARWFLDCLRAQPIHAFATAPVISFLSTDDGTGAPVIGEVEMRALLDDPAVLGLGEVYWHRLLPEPERLGGLIERARALGKTVEGHSAGARGAKLAAYAGAGVGSCHEPITAAEALERLRLGMFVFVREGSVRRDLAAVGAVRHDGVDFRRAALASDAVWPADLLAHGYMDGIVQKAIELGIPPVTAYRMASLNVAEHYRLDGDVGGIAPGRFADFVLLPDLRTVRPEVVVARGRVVAREGQCLAPLEPAVLPAGVYAGLRAGPLEPATLRLTAPGPTARVRVIRIAGDILTAEDAVTLPVRDGAVGADPGRDCLIAAALDRRVAGRRALGIVRGFGLREGAFASTVSFDTADLVVLGASPDALSAALRRVVELRGGLAVVDGTGAVRADLALPLGGVASDRPLPEVARGLEAIEEAARALGCQLPRPLLTLQTLTFTAIPALRLTARGLLDVKRQAYVPALL